MPKHKKGVFLINLGTPDSTKKKDVRKYLKQFLFDWRVIDIPVVYRWLLVNGIVGPIRTPKSAAEYKKVFTERGSPLLYLTEDLRDKVQESLGDDYVVSIGMRYQNPSLEKGLEILKDKGLKEIIVIPLYPQYASATTGSTIEAVNHAIKDWQVIPNLRYVSNFTDNEDFISAWEDVTKKYLDKTYDHFVFSFHGLPERQIKKSSCDNYCQLGACCNTYHSKNYYCYRAQCYETARQITKRLNIEEKDYTVCFQSRLGKTPWIQPYIDDVVDELIENDHKNVLVFSPAFVSDCLETTIEIGEEYKNEFLEKGGESWQLVESLNTNEKWVECLHNMVLESGRP